MLCVVEQTSLAENNEPIGPAAHDESLCRYPATQLLDKADEYVNSMSYDLARKFCQRALDAERDNIRALETLGFVELQSGDYEHARHVFFSVCNNCSTIALPSQLSLCKS